MVTVTKWLKHLRIRGRAIPGAGRHALVVTAEVICLNPPANYSAVAASTRTGNRRKVKQAPFPVYDL